MVRASSFEEFLEVIPPRYGPEWGSGGIFGLTYCNGVLYYTLAFDGEAHFIRGGYRRVYRFTALGPGPASGGDTYNASACVDNTIFFGGWVHNPAVYKGKRGFEGEIDFRNKYSHVHAYNIEEDDVKLLWSEGIRDESRWAGEVSEIVYDHVNHRLLLARADGHENLGVYSLNPRGGRAEVINGTPALKGSLFLDYACFDMQRDWVMGIDGIQCLDLVLGKWYTLNIEDWRKISVDGDSVSFRGSGYAISAYTRYFHFFRGGVLVGNPLEPHLDNIVFVRLFDFGSHIYSQLTPQRSKAITVGGGILAPFSSHVHGLLHSDLPLDTIKVINEVNGPSVLLYITPPQARIVGVYGARITSLAKMGSKVLIAYNTAPNLGGRDATPIEVGYRGIMYVDEDTLLNRGSPPVTFRFNGYAVGTTTFGGVPLAGYKDKKLIVKSSKSNTITINEYDIGLPPNLLSQDSHVVSEGRNVIDLGGYHNIISLRLREADPQARIYISLS